MYFRTISILDRGTCFQSHVHVGDFLRRRTVEESKKIYRILSDNLPQKYAVTLYFYSFIKYSGLPYDTVFNHSYVG